MESVTDLIKVALETGNNFVIGAVIAVCSLVAYKWFQDVKVGTHGIREKKLVTLLGCVKEGVSAQHRFTVEQHFEHGFKAPFTYDEIVFLLSSKAPSRAFRDYRVSQRLVKFDDRTGAIVPIKPIRFRWREWGLGGLFAVAVIAFMISALLLLAGLVPNAQISRVVVANSSVVIVTALFICWFSVYEARALFAAKRLVEMTPMTPIPLGVAPSAQQVSNETCRGGGRTKLEAQLSNPVGFAKLL
jgi:hypothetical protein